MPKITKRVVESLKPGTSDVFAWDTELKGFGVRVKPSGARSYLVQYRAHGRSRRMTIGSHGRLTAEEARRQARAVLADVDKGGDPAEIKEAYRKAPTMADLCDRYLADHAAVRKKASSASEDRRLISRHVKPALGPRKVADLIRTDIIKLHHGLRATPYEANRTLALLSKMMNLAEGWGIRPDGSNPCRHVGKFEEVKRKRYLSPEEIARLGDVLGEAERTATDMPSAIAAIRLLILTGCRLSEILTLQWSHVDLAGGWLRLPDSKSGAKEVHINTAAQAVLAGIDREEGSRWVIRGPKPGSHLVNLHHAWERIRGKAGLSDVRVHDLRHSFASVAVGMGLGLPVLGALLGHTQPATTARCAHLAADPVKAASERIGAAIAGMMMGKAGKVVPLAKDKR